MSREEKSMSKFENKVDFVVLISVNKANCNGDPLDGNRPRMDYNGYGEMTDVCIKRKIRNRMQDMGERVFVQSADRCDDGKKSLKARADGVLKGLKEEEFEKKACETWIDVRTFGQVFAFDKKTEGVSMGIRGPVSIHQAVSVSPIEIESLQITKSVNGKDNEDKKGSDTMGMKHFVRFGLYEVKGSINVQLASKTGFSKEDADVVKECLRTLFVNDASSARPGGSMEVVKLYWWQHDCKDGQYSSAKVHRSIKIREKDIEGLPSSVDDYEIYVDSGETPGLVPEEIDGI